MKPRKLDENSLAKFLIDWNLNLKYNRQNLQKFALSIHSRFSSSPSNDDIELLLIQEKTE